MKKIFKILLCPLAIIIIFLLAIFYYFFVGKAHVSKNITWGVDFSQSQAEYLKLNWKETFLAIINNLGVKNIKLHTNWNWVAGKQDNYYFNDIDWQIKQAEQKNVKIIYVVGMKTGRWPECHIPTWANELSKKDQQSELLKYITEVVQRYKNSKAIAYWQAENEPLFPFGECPWVDKYFLEKEVKTIKSLDPTRPVIVSDSGDLSLWLDTVKAGDILGVTMYRRVWFHITDNHGFYAKYPFPPMMYWIKTHLVDKFFGKQVICVELQAEPWLSKPFYSASPQEQSKSMNLDIFKQNVEYAKETGLDKFYFWGVEWWYWMKTTQNQPQIWEEAKKLFIN